MTKVQAQNRGSIIPIPLLLIISTAVFIHILCMIYANLLVEEAYYWNYAQHLDFGYLDHPPMVAFLIKITTAILGTNEFAVRSSSLFCWCLTVFFSYKWTELINRGAGWYSVMLLAVLPFFFLQSLVITPDIPLILCWSALLYCLYRVLILNEAHYWYPAGLCLGLGMLSKYTIVLLAIATFVFIVVQPTARTWLRRKEPYLAALLAALIFSPVIYWNATHEWVSFLFQSKRRFVATSSIDIHNLLMLLVIFITPLGAFSLWELLKKNTEHAVGLSLKSKRFVQIYTFVPLSFFALFSLNHEVNLNWIGPIFLALIPWLAAFAHAIAKKRRLWMWAACALLLAYSGTVLLAAFNTSEQIQQKLFIKAVAWESLIKQFHELAQDIEAKSHKKVIFAPLDNFPISSELAFYQQKLLASGVISKIYPTMGSHLFGVESLMYRYWSKSTLPEDAVLILITKEQWRFDLPELTKQVKDLSPIENILSTGQGQKVKNIPFYYKTVCMKA